MNHDTAREILLGHSKSKQNGIFPKVFTHVGELTNPLCGDQIEIKLKIVDGLLAEVGYQAKACAICTASASLLSENTRGKMVDEARKISEDFENNVLAPIEQVWPGHLSNLQSFEHLKVNPTRRACALLPWVALRSILNKA